MSWNYVLCICVYNIIDCLAAGFKQMLILPPPSSQVNTLLSFSHSDYGITVVNHGQQNITELISCFLKSICLVCKVSPWSSLEIQRQIIVSGSLNSVFMGKCHSSPVSGISHSSHLRGEKDQIFKITMLCKCNWKICFLTQQLVDIYVLSPAHPGNHCRISSKLWLFGSVESLSSL